jgi:hypothetical protein
MKRLLFCVVLLCTGSCVVAWGQTPIDTTQYAMIYFVRPALKAGANKNIELYLNSRPIYAIANKGRLAYRIYSEGMLRITNPAESRPSELALNIEKGRAYYVAVGKALIQLKDTVAAQIEYQDASIYTGETRLLIEDRNLPVPRMSIALESRRITEVAVTTDHTIKEKQQEIRKDMDAYFERLKQQHALSDGVEPRASVQIEEGESRGGIMHYNLRAAYSYEVVDNGVQAELTHYPSGAYLLETSKAASATAMAMKETIILYLQDYFEPGSVVNIRIIGSADAQPISARLLYKGEFDAANPAPYFLTDDYQVSFTGNEYKVDSVANPPDDNIKARRKPGGENKVAKAPPAKSPGTPKSFAMSPQQVIDTNPDLAFLRSYGIRSFMENEIPILKKTKNKFVHQAKIENGIGGTYRKVVIEIIVEDILRNK